MTCIDMQHINYKGGLIQSPLAIVDFYFFNYGPIVIQIRALLITSQCRVCDTQVTVNASVTLVHLNIHIAY